MNVEAVTLPNTERHIAFISSHPHPAAAGPPILSLSP